MNVEAVTEKIIEMLTHQLPKQLVYHRVEHTIDVLGAAVRYGNDEKISPHEMALLKTAAVLHDTGYLYRYLENEIKAVDLAKEILPHYGYQKKDIELINSCIMATRIPQSPDNPLAKILCDADLDYLGRDDFFETSEKLRVEWINYGLLNDNIDTWNEIQLRFITVHTYFTPSAIEKRNHKKQEHLRIIKNKLNRT